MNIFQYSCSVEQTFFKNIVVKSGYEPFTTFYSDITIGEVCDGIKGVKETIENVIKNWIDDYKYFTEFILCINYKSWEMKYRIDNNISAPKEDAKNYVEFYSKEFYRLCDLFYEHYRGNKEALHYFFEVTD